MEWVALIPTRSNVLRVRFTGGSLSGYGVTPATFTTSNPVVMRMIEDSHLYKSGKIRKTDMSEESTNPSTSQEAPQALAPIKKKK